MKSFKAPSVESAIFGFLKVAAAGGAFVPGFALYILTAMLAVGRKISTENVRRALKGANRMAMCEEMKGVWREMRMCRPTDCNTSLTLELKGGVPVG